MIYTSYFGNLKNIDLNKYLVASVCLYRPKWLSSAIEDWKFLAPSAELLAHWQAFHDEEYYYSEYLKKLKLYQNYIVTEFNKCLDRDIVLLCYEKPMDFCHRHLLLQFLQNNGLPCGGELGGDTNGTNK